MKQAGKWGFAVLCALMLVFSCFACAALAESNESRVVMIEWRDEDNYDGLRPDSVTLTLGQSSIVLDAAGNWMGEIEGSADSWGIQTVNGYSTSVSEGDITVIAYRHQVVRTEVSVRAQWVDEDDVNGVRPSSVQVRLLADGAPYGASVTLHKGNNWSASWSDLPRYQRGGEQVIAYTVEVAKEPAFYVAAVSGNLVTYTLQTGSLTLQASVSGLAEGADAGALAMTITGPDARMPMNVTLSQLAGGSLTLENLLPGAYLARETNADTLAEGYYLDPAQSATQDAALVSAGQNAAMTLRNVYTDTIVDPGTNADPTASYGNLTFEILGPDDRMPLTITYAQFTDGRYQLTDLTPGSYVVIERNAGTLVNSYTLQSDSVTGVALTVAADGMATASLFNHYAPAATPIPNGETVDIPVVKVWDDNGNVDANRPASVTVHLYADGAEVASAEISEAEGWETLFEALPRYTANNVEIVYSVNEDPVPLYRAEINAFTITNHYEPEVTSVSVRKVWDDNNNESGMRPTSIAMTLNNGMVVVLNEANGWAATVNNLPTIVGGEPAVYAWKEQEALGYVLQNVEQDGSTMIFTNARWTRPELEEGQKPPKVPGTVWYVFEEYDTPLGVEVVINHVGDCFD